MSAYPNEGAFFRLPQNERPTTGAMMTAIEEKIGHEAMMARLRENGSARDQAMKIASLWEEIVYSPESPA